MMGRIGAVLLSIALLLSACAGPPKVPASQKTVSHALEHPGSTLLGRSIVPVLQAHSNLSGFRLLLDGREAFLARLRLVKNAEKTLDLQYYIWEPDATGLLLMAAAIRAADRGVRVRLLLDDLNRPVKDSDLAMLDGHPRIELRLFNPARVRVGPVWDFVFDFNRMNHRMHNKAMIADNSLAVIGGRNIADHYFTVAEDSNFRDVDLLAAGPVVHDASDLFDTFWNSEWAVPVSAFLDAPAPPPAPNLSDTLAKRAIERSQQPFDLQATLAAIDAPPATLFDGMKWGSAEVIADRPGPNTPSHPGLLAELTDGDNGGPIQRELLVEVAYFIPGNIGVERLCRLVRRGVRVVILTNSFASNDVSMTHAGYARYRKALLSCGVQLHELRPDADLVERDWDWLSHESRANLHSKAAVVDRQQVIVGSFNMDPRSESLNTEMALMVHDPALAEELAGHIDSGMSLANSYRIALKDGGLQWITARQGAVEVYDEEPDVGLFAGLMLWLMRVLPLEGLL
jgi:putative cardiolipin synthase